LARYETFDLQSTRSRATKSPELFLDNGRPLLIIDEAQKLPNIFDEIKAIVDNKRTLGKFILSSKVRMSKRVHVREPLTGRTSTIRLEPLVLRETSKAKSFSLTDTMEFIEKGSMPGVCFLRDQMQRDKYWEQWLDTTCQRDLKIFGRGALSGDLAFEILEATVKLLLPNLSDISREINVDARRVKSVVEALEDLFILRPIPPAKSGVVKNNLSPF